METCIATGHHSLQRLLKICWRLCNIMQIQLAARQRSFVEMSLPLPELHTLSMSNTTVSQHIEHPFGQACKQLLGCLILFNFPPQIQGIQASFSDINLSASPHTNTCPLHFLLHPKTSCIHQFQRCQGTDVSHPILDAFPAFPHWEPLSARTWSRHKKARRQIRP